MKRLKLPRRIVATILLLQLVAVVAQSQKRGSLTQSEAVALAERFIEQNGYTDLPPDKTKLTYETIEWESNVDTMLQNRHDTLERRAANLALSTSILFCGTQRNYDGNL